MLELTHFLLFATTASLIIIAMVLLFQYLAESNYKRLKRRTQRDRNTKHIELSELRLEQIEERLGMLETKLN